jgi:hypothetical protein
MARNPQSRFSARRIDDVLADSGSNPGFESGTSPGSSLGQLLKQARFLHQLDQLLSGFLPPDLAAQCQVAAVRQNRMVLISPTAAWATRLRMQSIQMLDFLHASGHAGIQSIDIRVAPIQRPAPEIRSRHPLSPAAKKAMDLMTRKNREDVE